MDVEMAQTASQVNHERVAPSQPTYEVMGDVANGLGLAQLQQQYAQLRQNHAALQHRFAAQTAELEEAVRQRRDLGPRLDHARDTISQLYAQLKGLQKENELLKVANAARVAALEAQLGPLQAKARRQEKTISAQKAQLEGAERSLQFAATFRVRVGSLEGRRKDLTAQRDDTHQTLRYAIKGLDKLKHRAQGAVEGRTQEALCKAIVRASTKVETRYLGLMAKYRELNGEEEEDDEEEGEEGEEGQSGHGSETDESSLPPYESSSEWESSDESSSEASSEEGSSGDEEEDDVSVLSMGSVVGQSRSSEAAASGRKRRRAPTPDVAPVLGKRGRMEEEEVGEEEERAARRNKRQNAITGGFVDEPGFGDDL